MFISSLIRAILTMTRYRKTLHELNRLDDRMLRDIGLSRADLPVRAWESVRG